MLNWVMSFFRTDLFIPHGHCYLWQPGLVGLHLLSDAFIALAYYSIPLTLFYFVRRRPDLPFTWVFLLFSAFIVACGTTHLMAIWTLWHPVYWLSGAVKLTTAIVSLTTAVLLVRLAPQALLLTSPKQLEAANQALQREITDRKHIEAALQKSEARFRTLLKNTPGMLYRYFPGKDGAGMFTYVSFGSYALLELESDQILHDANAVWNLIHPDDLPSLQASVAIAVQNCDYWRWEGRLTTSSGQSKWIQGNSRPESTPEGVVWDGLIIDITDRKQTEAVIQSSLREKEVLLKEIHHRVKNNLGVVDGLLQMQARRSVNPEVIETLKESRNRIASIALVHEKLYHSDDLAKIDFAHYIADLTAHLFDSYNIHANRIKLTTHVDPIPLDIDTAIPCGLIINELVSNALKYAFSNRQMGEIQVTLQQPQKQYLRLTVQDDGVGLPQDFDPTCAKTLGLSLIQGLVKQLQGTLEINKEAGTTAVITFAIGH